MIHFREVRTTAVGILGARVGEGQPIERAVIIDDIFGKVRVLVWFAPSAPPTSAGDLNDLMRQKLGVYWADLWDATGAGEADRRLYEELWEESSERAPSVRLSERIRSLSTRSRVAWGGRRPSHHSLFSGREPARQSSLWTWI
jgi:hypothetical protein